MVGQTDAGETIYEARSARLVLRGDAAHFNRLVRCTKCGREVPGRAVLSPGDLDQPAQAVVCRDCVEAATQMSSQPGPLAEPVRDDDPAVADAQAEMNMGFDVPVDEELAGPADEEAEDSDLVEPDEGEVGQLVDDPDQVPPAAEETPAVAQELMDAGLDEDELQVLDEDEALVADGDLEDFVPLALADDDFFGGLGDDEPPAPGDDATPMPDAGLVEDEPPAPAPLPLLAVTHLDEHEPSAALPPTPPDADARPAGDEPIGRLDPREEPPAAGAHGDEQLTGLEPRIVAMILGLTERAAVQDERDAAFQARIEDLEVALEAAQASTEGDPVGRRLEAMEERLEQLQATIDAEWARTKSETATLAQAINDLGERVLRLAEQAGDTVGDEDRRLAAVEERVEEATTRLARALESQRRELQDRLRDGLADVLSAVPPAPGPAASPEDNDGRIRALERQFQQNREEVSDLNELHAALDAGLGTLRGELGDIRTTMARLADSKADLDDRLETFVRMSLVPEGDKGRKAKKAAESNLGTLSAAVQDLLREQRQLRDSFAGLERASDAATAAATRASTQATSLGPLRSDMKLLHQEIVEQQEALDALRRTVERLRQAPAASPPTPTPPSAAKRPAKPENAARATPAASAAAPAKRAAAKAAIAKAAATQATAAKKAPAAKKATRAKKA